MSSTREDGCLDKAACCSPAGAFPTASTAFAPQSLAGLAPLQPAALFSLPQLTSEAVVGSVGRWEGRSGTGEVASMRAGFRIMGSVIGGTPTCKGEARGWRIRGC